MYVHNADLGNSTSPLDTAMLNEPMELSLCILLSRGLCFSVVNFVSMYLSLVSSECN